MKVNTMKFTKLSQPFKDKLRIAKKAPTPLLIPEERAVRLKQIVEEEMEEGVDYGLFKGYAKAALLKPGAEKLCLAFGFSALSDVINRLEDWESGVFAYEIKVVLVHKETGVVEAEGLGSCNSKEASFKDKDVYTLVNTILKIAKKRALVDAVLSALNASSIFTQDVEDLSKEKEKEVKVEEELATKRQLRAIVRLVEEADISHEVAKGLMKENYSTAHSKLLTKVQASDYIQDLMHLRDAYRESCNLNHQYQNE